MQSLEERVWATYTDTSEHEYCRQNLLNLVKLEQSSHADRKADQM